MSQNSLHEISVQKVFDLISNYMKDAHDVLLEVLHKEPNYNRLLKTGEKQFFDATNESSIDAESMKSRLSVAQTSYLAIEVDRDIDKIVQEKFQGEILDNLKEEVLQAILWLASGEASTFPNKSEKDTENTALQIINSNNNCVQNNCKQASNGTNREAKPLLAEKLDLDDYCIQNNCKQASNGTNREAKPLLAEKLDLDDYCIQNNCKEASNGANREAKPLLAEKLDLKDCDADFLSFDSVSSVHTSDLSSFEDEISLSSEEEFGEKKRLSLREVQEKLEVSKSDIIECTDNKQDINIETEDAQSDSPKNAIVDSSSTSQKSQRKRKPNLKYTDDDVIQLPLKKKSNEKTIGSSRSVCGDTPRKRGRPRKLST